MQCAVSVKKICESLRYQQPNHTRVRRLWQCNSLSVFSGNVTRKDICCLHVCFCRLRSAAFSSRSRLVFSQILEFIRRGLRKDMRGLHVRTIFFLYNDFWPTNFIRLRNLDPHLLDEDFSDAVVNFLNTWTREGNCHEFTLWNVLHTLVKCKRDLDVSLMRAAAFRT